MLQVFLMHAWAGFYVFHFLRSFRKISRRQHTYAQIKREHPLTYNSTGQQSRSVYYHSKISPKSWVGLQACNKDGRTAFHTAVLDQCYETAKSLAIECGANIYAMGKKGECIAHLAATHYLIGLDQYSFWSFSVEQEWIYSKKARKT